MHWIFIQKKRKTTNFLASYSANFEALKCLNDAAKEDVIAAHLENIETFEEEEEVNSFDNLCSNISTIYDEDYACRVSASLNDDESDKVLIFVNQITFEKIKWMIMESTAVRHILKKITMDSFEMSPVLKIQAPQ